MKREEIIDPKTSKNPLYRYIPSSNTFFSDLLGITLSGPPNPMRGGIIAGKSLIFLSCAYNLFTMSSYSIYLISITLNFFFFM